MIEQNQGEINQLRSSMNEVLQLFSDGATYQRQTQQESFSHLGNSPILNNVIARRSRGNQNSKFF